MRLQLTAGLSNKFQSMVEKDDADMRCRFKRECLCQYVGFNRVSLCQYLLYLLYLSLLYKSVLVVEWG